MSMTLNAMPDYRSQIESMSRLLLEKEERIEALEQELRREKARYQGMAMLNVTLAPLYQALQMIFGHLDTIELPESRAAAAPKHSVVWESWKTKLGGKAGEAIDALLLHGEMNARQLRIHIKCGSEYVYKVITQLTQAGLVTRNDGRIRLKEL